MTTLETIWIRRGLNTLFGFAIASLIGASVSFVAYNWAYLGTGIKLGGLAVCLLILSLIWVVRKYDDRVAQSFGIAAQVTIGVWLAAAGQIYQAPGGLQDLLLNWALLGLPFAIASRAQAHWAVWFAVLTLAGLSQTGLSLRTHVHRDLDWLIPTIAALIVASGLLTRIWRKEIGWLNTTLSLVLFVLAITACLKGWNSPLWLVMIATLMPLSVMGVTFQRGLRAETFLLATGVSVVLLLSLIRMLDAIGFDTVLLFLLLAAFTALATYLLMRLHRLMSQDDRSDEDGQTEERPWYISAILGAGGCLTAIFSGCLIGAILGLSGLLSGVWELAILTIGGLCYGFGLFSRRSSRGPYLDYLLGTVILLGLGCILAGLFGLLDGYGSEAATFVGIAAITLSAIAALIVHHDGLFQGLMAITAVIGFALCFVPLFNGQNDEIATLILSIVYTLFGLGFALVTMSGKRLVFIAAIFLLAAIGIRLLPMMGASSGDWAFVWWIDLLMVSFAIVGLFTIEGFEVKRSLFPVLLIMLALAVWFPGGGAAALILLLLGYALRHTSLFGLGVVMVGLFLLLAYLDLNATLLQVSAGMVISGSVMLAIWWWTDRQVRAVR